MFKRHISRQLAAHLDGQLAQSKAQQAEIHLRQCSQCRDECEQVGWGMQMVEHLPLVEAPAALWPVIEAAFQENLSRQRPAVPVWRWVFAAMAILAVAGAAYWRFARPSGTRWEVVRLDGSPSVGGEPIRKAGRVAAGEWIETDARSRASVKVGEIGSVEIAPGTRVRVVGGGARAPPHTRPPGARRG
jgi:predicted anti-sigma-YlaC factor YlaD